MLLRADKAYGITADGKIVHPTHPLCRQILSHEAGQEVPSNLLLNAGLATKENGKDPVLTPKDYDLVSEAEIEAVMGAPTATPATPAAAPAPAPTVEELLATPEAQAVIAKLVADQVAALVKPASLIKAGA